MSLADILIYTAIFIGSSTFALFVFSLCYVAKHCSKPSDDFHGDQV